MLWEETKNPFQTLGLVPSVLGRLEKDLVVRRPSLVFPVRLPHQLPGGRFRTHPTSLWLFPTTSGVPIGDVTTFYDTGNRT